MTNQGLVGIAGTGAGAIKTLYHTCELYVCVHTCACRQVRTDSKEEGVCVTHTPWLFFLFGMNCGSFEGLDCNPGT